MEKSFGIAPAKSTLLMSTVLALSIPLYGLAGRLTRQFGAATVLCAGITLRIFMFCGLGLIGALRWGSSSVWVIVLFVILESIWPLLSVAANDSAAELCEFGKGTVRRTLLLDARAERCGIDPDRLG